MQPDKNPTASSLFGVAAILLLVGLLGWFMYGPQFGLLDWIVSFSGVIYLGLAVAARRFRLAAALIATALFAVYVAYQAYWNVEFLWRGWIIKAPIALLLLVAIFFALKASTKGEQKSEARVCAAWLKVAAEPTDEADRGRHPGFARHEGLAGGPGSLSLSFGSIPGAKEMSMKLLARTLFQLALALGLLTGPALAKPVRPAPQN